MKQLARIMQQNAPMQTRLQTRLHHAERRADFRAVFRAEKMAAMQKWFAEIGADSRAVVDAEANAERETEIVRIQYKIRHGETPIRWIGTDYLCSRGAQRLSVFIRSIRPVRGLFSICKKMAQIQNSVQNHLQIFVQYTVQMIVQIPCSRSCSYFCRKAALMQKAVQSFVRKASQ